MPIRNAAILLATAACACLAQAQGPSEPPPEKQIVGKLQYVQWDPDARKLTWKIRFEDGDKTVAYSISTNEASMSEDDGVPRFFAKQEAAEVNFLLELVSRYAAASTVWWMEGKGAKSPDAVRPPPGRERRDGTANKASLRAAANVATANK